jgi:hypothetical protein
MRQRQQDFPSIKKRAALLRGSEGTENIRERNGRRDRRDMGDKRTGWK